MELLLAAELHCLEDGAIGEVCEKIAELGIGKLVLSSGTYERELQEPGYLAKVHRQVEKAGLGFASAHGLWSANNDLNWPDERGRREMTAAQRVYIERAAELGCRTFVLHPGVAYMRYDRGKLWDCVRRSVEELLPEAEKNGVILALENNVTMNLGIDCAELSGFIRSFASDNLGACFDTGHANAVSDVLESLAEISAEVVTAHLHDNDGTGDQHRYPGQGVIPWENLMDKLSGCPRLLHVESEPAGMKTAQKIIEAAEIYRELPGIGK